MAFVDMHTFSRDFLHFDMSLLLLTLTLRGVSNKHCLLSLFSFYFKLMKQFNKFFAFQRNQLSSSGSCLTLMSVKSLVPPH